MSIHADAQNNFSNMSPHSLRLTADGDPRVAYGGDHLFYSYKDAGGWHTQVVDSSWGVGSGAALALDPSGNAHISYYDTTSGNLKYATNKSGSWWIDTVAALGDVGRYSDIAIDAWGDPTIVYFDATNGQLRYVYYDSEYGGWGNDVSFASVTDPGHPGWFSLALDTGPTPNKPHVSYYQRTNASFGDLGWAHYNASNDWVTNWIDSCVEGSTQCRIGEYNAIALDPANLNRPAIAYSYYDHEGMQLLMYRYYNGTSWIYDISAGGSIPTSISMGIDVSGDTHLAWMENGYKFAKRLSQDNWQTATLDAGTSLQWSSLAVVGTTAKVAYFNDGDGFYYFKDQNRGTWQEREAFAVRGHNVGNCSSIKVDSLNQAHISYFDDTSHSLIYLRYSPDGSKYFDEIATGAGLSCYSVLAVSPSNDYLSVAYISNGNLYYLQEDYWDSPVLMDTGVDPGYNYQSFGLAVASNGAPHFAYRKGTNLWYTYWTGSAWSKTLLTSSAEGKYVALALGPNDLPHIAYYTATELKHTYYTGSAWSTSTIAAKGISGSGTGVLLAVDPSGKPMAAYMNSYAEDLRVSSAVCSPACAWGSSMLLDDGGYEEFSLAMDGRGNPHLAAATFTPGSYQLHYISRRGSNWIVLQADVNRETGFYPSIALSRDGIPYISYRDMAYGDLKLLVKYRQVLISLAKR